MGAHLTIRKGRCACCGRPAEWSHPRGLYCSDRCRLLSWAKKNTNKKHRRVRPRMWEVLEPDAVPREYLVVNAARVEKALREGREVPGVARKEEG